MRLSQKVDPTRAGRSFPEMTAEQQLAVSFMIDEAYSREGVLEALRRGDVEIELFDPERLKAVWVYLRTGPSSLYSWDEVVGETLRRLEAEGATRIDYRHTDHAFGLRLGLPEGRKPGEGYQNSIWLVRR